MKIRSLSFASMSTVATLFGLGQVLGCSGPGDESAADETLAALSACHLNDGTVEHDALIRACDPQDAKKTTICHVPPGNPANTHTLCVGNPAVPAHMKHHGDHVGRCQSETPCPPPPSTDSHGTGGSGPTSTGGSSGSGSGGTAGAGVTIVIL
jgi:hypothetical protein